MKYRVSGPIESLHAGTGRVALLLDSGEFDVAGALRRTIEILSRNPKGYFLLVEWDSHTDRPRRGLDHVVELDRAIRETAGRADAKDTLLLFTADHSFDLRTLGGRRGEPLLPPAGEEKPVEGKARPTVKVEGSHTGEEVLVAAKGPGAQRVRGYLDNTDLFGIMMDAYGWRR
jgi:alkaline phosphatase